MWKKIKEILAKHTPYKDESAMASGAATTAASIIDLRLSPIIPSQRTEASQRQVARKLGGGGHTLNKTDEHCRSLFSLLPTSLRPHHQHQHHRQAAHKKGIDASTRTQPSPTIGVQGSDYDSDYMSQTYLNRTASYASCHSANASQMPSSSINRHGSIESLLHGHSKSNPASVRVIVRKNFEPFAQAHIAVVKGTVVCALFSRGPWLYVRVESTGKTGYIPRLICASFTELESVRTKRREQVMNRHLSHSSAIIDETKPRRSNVYFDERERRNTYTLPFSPRAKPSLSSNDRRLTLSSINSPLATIPRDTDSSSTQDSGYSESTPFFLVQQATPENEQPALHPFFHMPKKCHAIPHYATVRRTTLLKVPDPINPSQSQPKPRQSLLNGRSMNDMNANESAKRHSFGVFNDEGKLSAPNSPRRLPEFALIRNVRRDKCSIYNLPKSHVQIPASIFLSHHRQKQQFGSSHSAFRPVQPSSGHKRASSEGHSPPSSPSSLSSSDSSVAGEPHASTRRRLSFDYRVPILSSLKGNSLTRSVCDPVSSTTKLNQSSRTMSDILCDQFSEINLDAIEQDSLVHHPPTKKSQQCLFTLIKDYRSSRASFAVKRGECVYVLKQVGRACYLVRKQHDGQIGFVPRALLTPATSTKVDAFLKMHECRETVI